MLSDSDSLDDILLPPATTAEATLPDSDSLDIFLLPATATDRTLGKFRPKPRLKAIKQVPTTSIPSDAPQLLSSISKPPPAPVRKCPEEGSILPASGVIGLSTSSPDLHVVEEYANQPESLDSEALVSNGDHVEVSLSGQENSGQDADTFFGMESLDDNIQPALTTVRAVGRFQPKANSRTKDNKLVTPRNAVPGCAESVHASTSSCSNSALDPGYSELNLTHEPVHVTEEPVVHTEASNDGAHVSGSDANLETDPASQDGAHVFESNANIETDPDKSVAEATAVFDCMESPDDTLFHPSAASAERALGKFRPKLHRKITKSIPASSNSDATQIISPFLEPLPHASDVKCPEDGLSLSSSFTTGSSTLKTCDSEIHVTQESVNHLEASLLILNGDNAEASHGDQGKLGEVADMFFSMESLDDDIQHASPTGVEESVGVSNVSSSSSTPMLISSKLNATQEPLNISKESSIHEEACQDGPQVSESDGNLQTIPDKPEEEAMTVLSGIESLDDIVLQNSATAVKQVGKFHPKIVSRPKERKAKSVSFILPDAAETVAPPEEFHSCNSTGADPSFLEMMSDGFLDKTPQSSSVISDCSVDFHWDHGRMGKEDTAEFSGFESLDNILSQPTSSTDRSVGKFQPKPSGKTKIVKPSASLNSHGATESISSQLDSLPEGTESMEGHDLGFPADSLVHSVTWDCNSMPTDLAHDQADHFETSTLKAPSPGSSDGLQTIIRTLGRDNYIGGKRKLSTVSKDIGNGVQSQDVEELTQQILDERSSSKSVEDGVSKSSRKLRKRVVCSPSGKVDGGTSEDWDVENSNISEMDEDHSDDEYRGKDMPKQKRAPKKSKRQMTENHKPIQRRKKASEEPDSTKQEPPKKKFPHGTRRKRRQVDKVLLEMPEYEIDPKQLKIKDLIMLAEAKERISSKESAALRTSQSNTGSFPSDTRLDQDNLFGEEQDPNLDGDEAHRNMLRNSTKLNYHSYMNRPQSGRWSKSETELFYQAIRQFGTDFAMIQQLFPNRTRHQVKLKFKNEERKHPLQVADAIIHRSKDHSHFERVIQQLQAQAEQNSKIDANDDPTTVSKDAADGNEDERGEPGKEEEAAANGFEGEADNSVKYNNWDEDGQGPSHFNGYEGVFEWDANASSPQDMEKYTFYDEL